MDSIWNGASFITTEFNQYFSTEETPWMVDKPRLYQHRDLPYGAGLPMFVHDFEVEDTSDVRMLFTSLGCNDVFINGQRVGSDEMKPGWSDYNKRVLYDSVDIGPYVHRGTNRLLAVLAGGWYSGRIVGNAYGAKAPSFMATVTEGGICRLKTDATWKAKVGGQIRIADIWDGEMRDARKDGYEAVSVPSYDVSEWDNADLYPYTGLVTPFIGPKVRVREALNRKADTMKVYDGIVYNGSNYGEVHICNENAGLPLVLKKGQTLVIDLAQEIVGWAKILVKSPAGNQIRIRYAEFLNDSGSIARGNDGPKGALYTINYRSALAKAYYITSGKSKEEYRPTFTFFGFRYVEISAEEDFELLAFTAEVVGSDTRETGTIETDNALVNQLISNTIWGQRSNYLSVPTDCPQRDERFGWTGDAQAFSTTAAYNADVLGFFRKWLQDMRDSQSEEGAYSDIVPRTQCCSSENASAWGDAGIIIPYNLYRIFGDKQLLAEHYDSMEKYIAQLIKNFGMSGPIPRFGDWLAYDKCPNEFISSAYFVHDLDLMTAMSRALEKEDRTVFYSETAKEARKYFEDHFMRDGRLIGTSQCEKVISLAFRLIDGVYASCVADELEEQIRENGNRLSTGFLGTYNLCPTLSEFGKDKMAYTLLMQRSEPSWLYSIDQGATTIWERWNSYTKEKGFGDVGMNSFNHYAYGAIVEWMYRYMAGIESGGAGFETFRLQPRVDTRTDAEIPEGQQRMTRVRASFESNVGLICSAWNYEKEFVYECTVPEKATAVLYLPVFADTVSINGISHSVDEFKVENGCMTMTLTGGTYTFIEA